MSILRCYFEKNGQSQFILELLMNTKFDTDLIVSLFLTVSVMPILISEFETLCIKIWKFDKW